MQKKYSFYFLLLFLILFFITALDLILSNTYLKSENCYKFEKYYYSLKKNCKGKNKFKKSFPTVNVYTDEYGLRVKKKFVKRDKNKENIFIFGDSFTFGVGLNYENTYVGLIENKIKKYNYYNFAVSGYSPSVHYYILNKTLKKKIIPKKIIIFLDLTDVLEEANRWTYEVDKDEIKLTSNEVYKKNNNNSLDFKSKNFKIILYLDYL